jgi:hypothetical protein
VAACLAFFGAVAAGLSESPSAHHGIESTTHTHVVHVGGVSAGPAAEVDASGG